MSSDRKIAIIGSGLIGGSWASIFTGVGCRVVLYDSNSEHLASAPDRIRAAMTSQHANQPDKYKLGVDERMALISVTNSLAECLQDASHVQECVFDDLALKQALFAQIDELIGDDNRRAAICSSTSIHLPSKVFANVTKHKDQCLVAHPVNPPMHVRLVELIPHSTTREEVLIQTRLFMDQCGQKPVVLRKEVSGFALNRLQYAVFQEAFRLIHEGVMTPDDVDTVVSDGLGPRYAFMGPWMTAHLNAIGMADYFERYRDGIYNVGKDCQPLLKLEGEAAQQIVDSMMHQVPVDKLNEKREWRDKCLVELAKLKDSL